MGYPLPKLTRKNQHTFFGKDVKHGDLFNYSMAFLFPDIEHLAKKHGYWIKYCGSGTDESKKHGSFVCYAYELNMEFEKETSEPTISERWEESRNKIGDLVLRFEAKKNEVAKLRDDLRYIAEEATEIVDSIDDGVEGMEDAIESFKHALDDMSRYI